MHDRAISIQNDKHREAKILSSSNLHSGLRSRFFLFINIAFIAMFYHNPENVRFVVHRGNRGSPSRKNQESSAGVWGLPWTPEGLGLER